MGAIQNSMNQVVGTASGMVAMGRHLQNQEIQTEAIKDSTKEVSSKIDKAQ